MQILMIETDMMTAANPLSLDLEIYMQHQLMKILMIETDMMTTANPLEFRPTNI